MNCLKVCRSENDCIVLIEKGGGKMNLSLAFIGVFIALSVCIGIFVYRDTRARNMDAILWMLIAVLSPCCIGLFVYLAIRKNSVAGVQDDKTELQAERKVGLKKSLLTVVAILLSTLLFYCLFLGIGHLIPVTEPSKSSRASIENHVKLTLDENHVSSEVVEWASRCDAEGKGIYALRVPYTKMQPSTIEFNALAEEIQESYCVYIYANLYKNENPENGFLVGCDGMQNTLTVSLITATSFDENWPSYDLCFVCTTGYGVNKLKILVDGEDVRYSFSELP